MAMIIPPTNTIRLLSSSLLHHSFWNIIAIVNHHHHCHLISSVLIIKTSLPSIIIRFRSGFVWWWWMVEVRRGVGRTQDSTPTQSCSFSSLLVKVVFLRFDRSLSSLCTQDTWFSKDHSDYHDQSLMMIVMVIEAFSLWSSHCYASKSLTPAGYSFNPHHRHHQNPHHWST